MYATPLFQAAGLSPESIGIYIVKDKSLNAFVAGGQRLFLNSGLLMKTDNAGQVVGVIAHEAGHIAGGHLTRMRGALETASASTILSALLGAAAAVGTGRPDLGIAVIAAGQTAGQGTLLHFNRTQEGAADQAGIRFLESTGTSSKGLLEFFNKLENQELLSARHQDPYVRTHPLTRERINDLRAHIQQSPFSDTPVPASYTYWHDRMKAKLIGFLEPFQLVLRYYPASDKSEFSRYARAIAHYRKGRLAEALPLVDGLITGRPDDPYYHELRGQMLFENGDAKAALPSYERAVSLLEGSALLQRDLARVRVALNDPALLDAAVDGFRRALKVEGDSPFTWHQLAIALGRQGKMGLSSLALAEEALLVHKLSDARYNAERAIKLFPAGSPAQIRAQDVLNAVTQAEGKK